MKSILTKVNLGPVYDTMSSCNISMLNEKLMNVNSVLWKNDVENKPKLRTYVQLKSTFATEKYVLFNLERKEKSLLAQLRFGNLPLRIETGRYVDEKVEDRLCTLCTAGTIEDEIHFIFHCDRYKDIRNSFIENVNNSCITFEFMSIVEKLVYLFENKARQLAKFVCKAYSIRRSVIYN